MKLDQCFEKSLSSSETILKSVDILDVFEKGGLTEWLIRKSLGEQGYLITVDSQEQFLHTKAYLCRNDIFRHIVFAPDLTKAQRIALFFHFDSHLRIDELKGEGAIIYEPRKRNQPFRKKLREFQHDIIAKTTIKKYLEKYSSSNMVIHRDLALAMQQFPQPSKLYQVALLFPF